MNLIFLHGIVGLHHFFRRGYLQRIADFIRWDFRNAPEAVRTLLPISPTAHTVQERAASLRQQILAAFARGSLDEGAPTHIFGHSMGGLDARYLVSPANAQNLGERVRTLVLMGTPNTGTPIVDYLVGSWRNDPVQDEIEKISRSLLNKLKAFNVNAMGLADLTSDRMVGFNQEVVDHPQVQYRAVAGVGRGGVLQASLPFKAFHQITRALTGEPNDGLVHLSSASWGNTPTQQWRADHADLADIDLNFPFFPLHFATQRNYRALIKSLI